MKDRAQRILRLVKADWRDWGNDEEAMVIIRRLLSSNLVLSDAEVVRKVFQSVGL